MTAADFDKALCLGRFEVVLGARLDAMGRTSVAHAARICPRKTGRLARSIRFTRVAGALTLKFGTDLLYGRFQEIGTWKTPPRSFLRRTAMELASQYEQIGNGK